MNYYEHSIKSRTLADFLVLFPQILDVGDSHGNDLVDGLGERTTVQRKRDSNNYYGEFTDPSHRAVAVAFNGPMSNALRHS